MKSKTKLYFMITTALLLVSSVSIIQLGFANPSLNQNSKTLIYALPYDFTEFSSFTVQSYATAQWLSAVTSGLFKRSAANSRDWVPDLAASMPTVSANSTQFTVKLKPNLKFADGTPITADDVVFSFKARLTPLIDVGVYPIASQYMTNSSVSKIDSSTVFFNLTRPYAFALGLLASTIVEKSHFQSRYDSCVSTKNATVCNWDASDGSDVASTGPFKVQKIDTTNMVVTVVKDTNYWDAANTKLDSIVFQKVSSKAAALGALASGTINLMDSQYVPYPSELKLVRGITATIVGDPAHQEISLNHFNPYFGNGSGSPASKFGDSVALNASRGRLVRHAMSLIVDRSLAANQILQGLGQPAASTMPSSAFGWDANIKPDPFNITMAKEMMTKAGYDYSKLGTPNNKTGVYPKFFFNVTVLSPNTNPARNQWSDNFAAELPKIGIGVTKHVSTGWGDIQPRTFGSDVPPKSYDKGGFDVFFVGYGWGLDWDPTGLYEKSNWRPVGGNFYNYNNRTLENAISNYTSTLDPVKRTEWAVKVQQLIHQDLPVIPIVYPKSQWAWSDTLTGIDALLLSTSSLEWGNVAFKSTTTTSSTPTGTTTTSTPTPVSLVPFIVTFVSIFIAITLKRKVRK